MGKIDLVSISARTTCHATEDADSVKKSVLSLLPEKQREECDLKTSSTKGAHHNPIQSIWWEFKNRRQTKSVLEYWIDPQSGLGIDILQDAFKIGCNSDKSEIVFRIDKGKASVHQFALASGGYTVQIRIKLAVYSGTPDCNAIIGAVLNEYSTE